jgi:hypothetical protein
MDLTTAIVGIQSAKISSQIDYAVAKKILDTQKQAGAGVLQLLESATTGVNQAGNNLVAAATGLGQEVDVAA